MRRRFRMSCGRKPAGLLSTHTSMRKVSFGSNSTALMNLFRCLSSGLWRIPQQ
uniref:Uncharacterized protein n=1 Tax=Phlebotomus papatasi TaxID=29031 RepID=A0A1B0GMH8_PHLPP